MSKGKDAIAEVAPEQVATVEADSPDEAGSPDEGVVTLEDAGLVGRRIVLGEGADSIDGEPVLTLDELETPDAAVVTEDEQVTQEEPETTEQASEEPGRPWDKARAAANERAAKAEKELAAIKAKLAGETADGDEEVEEAEEVVGNEPLPEPPVFEKLEPLDEFADEDARNARLNELSRRDDLKSEYQVQLSKAIGSREARREGRSVLNSILGKVAREIEPENAKVHQVTMEARYAKALTAAGYSKEKSPTATMATEIARRVAAEYQVERLKSAPKGGKTTTAPASGKGRAVVTSPAKPSGFASESEARSKVAKKYAEKYRQR